MIFLFPLMEIVLYLDDVTLCFLGHESFHGTRVSYGRPADTFHEKATWSATEFLCAIAECSASTAAAGAYFTDWSASGPTIHGTCFFWTEYAVYAVAWTASCVTAIDATEFF